MNPPLVMSQPALDQILKPDGMTFSLECERLAELHSQLSGPQAHGAGLVAAVLVHDVLELFISMQKTSESTTKSW